MLIITENKTGGMQLTIHMKKPGPTEVMSMWTRLASNNGKMVKY